MLPTDTPGTSRASASGYAPWENITGARPSRRSRDAIANARDRCPRPMPLSGTKTIAIARRPGRPGASAVLPAIREQLLRPALDGGVPARPLPAAIGGEPHVGLRIELEPPELLRSLVVLPLLKLAVPEVEQAPR